MDQKPFMWGVATSSYQIEGAANADGRTPSIWDTFSKTPGKVTDGTNGDVACDHYHRYAEDIDLLSNLGVDAYRFSIAWPRIMPDGKPNQQGIDFYGRLVERLTQRGIASYVTLYHWDLPQALEDDGGWTNRATPEAFAEYAATIASAIGNNVTSWATLNEPWCSAYLGYGVGVHAPGRTNLSEAFSAAHHLNLAHGLGVRAIRANGGTNVGVVLNLAPVRMIGEGPEIESQVTTEDVWRNRIWLDPLADGAYGADVMAVATRDGDGLPIQGGDLEAIAEPIDWLGINYYHDLFIPEPPPGPRTNIGWPITPSGMYDVIALAAARLQVPLYITENGGAFGSDDSLDDQDRIEYLEAHIAEVQRARGDGFDVRGYFQWSLMDNFEWAEGYLKRFGLVHVDYDSLKRSPRASFDWYRRLIESTRT